MVSARHTDLISITLQFLISAQALDGRNLEGGDEVLFNTEIFTRCAVLSRVIDGAGALLTGGIALRAFGWLGDGGS